MKQNTLKWLSGSLILLSVLSCKKQRGVLDDFTPGRFEFVCIRNENGVQDTTIGEVSGPDGSTPYNYFMVKQELDGIPSLKDFEVGAYSRMENEIFYAPGLLINAKITYEEHDSDHLLVTFRNDSPQVGALVSGTFKLTRKE